MSSNGVWCSDASSSWPLKWAATKRLVIWRPAGRLPLCVAQEAYRFKPTMIFRLISFVVGWLPIVWLPITVQATLVGRRATLAQIVAARWW